MTALPFSSAMIGLALLARPAPDVPVTPESARQAIGRSLPFIEKQGLAWIKERGCVSCHQVPSMVWSLNEAGRHGFAIDRKKLEQWNAWTVENAFGGKVHYGLSEQSLKKLRQAKASEEELARLQPLAGKEFLTEREFGDEVAKLLSPEAAAKRRAAILKAAEPRRGRRRQGWTGLALQRHAPHRRRAVEFAEQVPGGPAGRPAPDAGEGRTVESQ
jgi:hypothetical protein